MRSFVRPAEARDVPRIAEIVVFSKRLAYRDIFRDDFASFNGLQVVPLAEEFRSRPGMLAGMLVYDDGIVKGCVSAVPCGGGRVELRDFYVDFFFRRQGIGRALVGRVLEDAVPSAAARELFLWVLRGNSGARLFYEALGFSFSGETQFVPGTSVEEVLYTKTLS